jgi:hypothetical protein
MRHTRLPITVTARCKAWTVFARSNIGIVGSNPTRGINVCARLFCVCVVLRAGSRLATGWSPVQGVLSTVYRIKKLKKRPRSNKRMMRHRIDQAEIALDTKDISSARLPTQIMTYPQGCFRQKTRITLFISYKRFTIRLSAYLMSIWLPVCHSIFVCVYPSIFPSKWKV